MATTLSLASVPTIEKHHLTEAQNLQMSNQNDGQIEASLFVTQDDHLSKITGGTPFIDGFCTAVGIASIIAPIVPPLAVPTYVAGAACAVYAAYNFF